MYTLGERIKLQRQKLGLTQLEFGAMFHVSKQAVYAWENDINLPDASTLAEIADYCRIPICTLIGQPRKFCKLDTLRSLSNPPRDYLKFTAKEIRLINRLRTLSPAQQKAIEVILGLRND